jgi:hypothetical protein
MGSCATQRIPFVLRGKKLPVFGMDFPFSERLVKQGRPHDADTRKQRWLPVSGRSTAIIVKRCIDDTRTVHRGTGRIKPMLHQVEPALPGDQVASTNRASPTFSAASQIFLQSPFTIKATAARTLAEMRVGLIGTVGAGWSRAARARLAGGFFMVAPSAGMRRPATHQTSRYARAAWPLHDSRKPAGESGLRGLEFTA